MTARFFSESVAELTAWKQPQSNSEPIEVYWTLRGKNNSESPYLVEDRSTGGLALPAVPPAQTASIPSDSHRLDARWDCET